MKLDFKNAHSAYFIQQRLANQFSESNESDTLAARHHHVAAQLHDLFFSAAQCSDGAGAWLIVDRNRAALINFDLRAAGDGRLDGDKSAALAVAVENAEAVGLLHAEREKTLADKSRQCGRRLRLESAVGFDGKSGHEFFFSFCCVHVFPR